MQRPADRGNGSLPDEPSTLGIVFTGEREAFVGAMRAAGQPAHRIASVRAADGTVDAVVSGVGTGGMLTKVQAATMAADSGIPTALTAAPHVARALAGEDFGTYFGVTHRRRQTRLLWLAHLAETHGTIHVDAGAARALLRRGTSLLAAGVTAVSGAFEAGDPVDVRDPAGDLIARGMVNFGAHELPGMFGMSIDELGDRFGGDYRKEVIHRNDLVLTDAVF